MGRYTGPTERLSRRAGVELELKGERRMARKSGLDRRANPPGEHGHRSGRRKSTYAIQLAAKQAAKRYYGVRERQFRRYVREAQRATGATGERLLQLLELRLDNVVTRLGFAATRAQARQFACTATSRSTAAAATSPRRAVAPGDIVAIRAEQPGATGRASWPPSSPSASAVAAGRHRRRSSAASCASRSAARSRLRSRSS